MFLLFFLFNGVQSMDLLEEVREYLKPLHENIASVELVEVKGDNCSTSTSDKKTIFLCLCDKNGNYYSKEKLAYAFLHCFAFTLCDEYGHTSKWASIFNSLLERAAELGIDLENLEGTELYWN